MRKPGMHWADYRKPDGKYKTTMPGQIATFLTNHSGLWVSNISLARVINSPCISTHISSVRLAQHASPDGWEIESKAKMVKGEMQHFYRARFPEKGEAG